MLTGENSLLKRTTQAKKLTDESEFKEQLQLAVMASYDPVSGKFDATEMKNNIQKDISNVDIEEDTDTITASLSGKKISYKIDKTTGNIEKSGVKIVATLTGVKIVNSSGTEVATNSTDGSTTKLYIKFGVNVDQGTITSVTDSNGTVVTATNGEYSYEISANGDYRFIVNATVDGESASKTTDAVTVSQFAVRAGIKVGDYVEYTSPTASVTFNNLETGYSSYESSPATLSRKTKFRVMNINQDGSMDLMGVVESSDPTICFYGANGYNNAVYTLNKKCSDLYKNESLGITARSIKEEDITSKFNSTGTDAISSYISTQVGNLTTGSYITDVDTTNNKVTYVRGSGYYPDIFQYEAGGVLDGTATSGAITGSQSYSGYNGLTTATYSQVTNNNGGTLIVPYTYYYITPTSSYFDNSDGNASQYQNMFFGTNTYYWLASRCVNCGSNSAFFGLRWVNSSDIYAYYLFYSSCGHSYRAYHVCPVVSLPSSVRVTPCTGTNSGTNMHTVVTT